MMRAYNIVAQTDDTCTYQYNTVCGYWLYSTVAIAGVGYVLEMRSLWTIALVSLIAYFAIIYFPALKDARKINSLIKTSQGTISGSRWSFANPLTVTVKKAALD